MANSLEHINITDIIDEYLEDLNINQEEVNYENYKRWASDCVQWIQTPDKMRQKVVLTHTKMGKVVLPDDFFRLQQISYRKVTKEKGCGPTPKHKITEWVQHDYNSGLDINIKVNCPKCGPKACSCKSNAVEIDVDRIFQLDNPFHDYVNKFSRPGEFGEGYSRYTDKFRLMRYSTNDYFGAELHIPECHNLYVKECDHQYIIDYPVIQTDIKEDGTEILLSYIGIEMNEDGDIMLPNQPDLIDAIKFNFTYKRTYAMYHKSFEQKYERAYQKAELDRERAIGLAKAAMDQLENGEFYSLLENIMYKRQFSGNKYKNHNARVTPKEDTWIQNPTLRNF